MDEPTEPELIEPNDVISERIRDAFLHHIKFGRNRSDDDSIARDTYGVRWRFIDPYEYMNRPKFYFNLCTRPNSEATRVAWDPGFELGTDATQEAAIQQRVTELWPLPFREEYRLVQGERATRVAWEERAAGGDAEDGGHQSNMRWHCSPVSPGSPTARDPLWWLHVDGKGDYPEHSGQISYFYIPCGNRSISLPCLALICHQLPFYKTPYKKILGAKRQRPVLRLDMDLTLSFTHSEPFSCIQFSGINATTTLGHQLKYFKPSNAFERSLRVSRTDEGLLTKRQSASLRVGMDTISLAEHVSSAILFAHGDGARWGITVLLNEDVQFYEDNPATARKIVSLPNPVTRNGSPHDGRDSEKCFHFILMELFDRAEDGWNETLEAINSSAGVTLNDFSSDELKDQLMFDRSFQRSRDYFTALQLLRLVDKWADENVAALEKLAESWQREVRAQPVSEKGVLLDERCFDATITEYKNRTAAIHDRVKVLKEDITGLRDGLFNATSLREATRGTSLNMTLYLFTIVTIIYAPIGFLATFWAMPYLNTAVNSEEQVARPRHLLTSFITVPLLTYITSGVFALYFWPTHPRGKLVERLLRPILNAPGIILVWLRHCSWAVRRAKRAFNNARRPRLEPTTTVTDGSDRFRGDVTGRDTTVVIGGSQLDAAATPKTSRITDEAGTELTETSTPRPNQSAESAMENGELARSSASEGGQGHRSSLNNTIIFGHSVSRPSPKHGQADIPTR